MVVCPWTQKKCSKCWRKLATKASPSPLHSCTWWCHWRHLAILDRTMVSISALECQSLSDSKPVCSGSSPTLSLPSLSWWVFSWDQVTPWSRKAWVWCKYSRLRLHNQARLGPWWWWVSIHSQVAFKANSRWRWDLPMWLKCSILSRWQKTWATSISNTCTNRCT